MRQNLCGAIALALPGIFFYSRHSSKWDGGSKVEQHRRTSEPTRPFETGAMADNDRSWIIRLADRSPIAGGGESWIYERPDKPSQLIKVHNVSHVEGLAASKALKNRLRRLRGIGPHKTLLRLNRAYLLAALRGQQLGRRPPIAHQRGVVLTDLGLGMIAQKIRDENGDLAPSVGQLHAEGRIDETVVGALTVFAGEMSAFQIIGNDLLPGNLVYETRRGASRIILIEGFGSRTLIPMREFSRRMNDRSLSHRFDELASLIELVWDKKSWSFNLK